MTKENKKGISLIVLVVTIVVMGILASVVILSLINEGIIELSEEKTQEIDYSNAKEIVEMAKAGWEVDKVNIKEAGIETIDEYIEYKLDKSGYTKNEIIEIISLAKMDKAAEQFYELKVPIGATVVGYDLSSNTTTSYTTSGKENTKNPTAYTETNPQPATITRANSLVWKYIGMDEGGNALIAADSTGNLTTMTLGGKGGYLYGPTVLDKTCEVLYSSNMGKARSMNIDDVTRILKYTGATGGYNNSDEEWVATEEPMRIGDLEEIEYEFSYRATPDDETALEDYYSNYYYIYKTSIDVEAGDTEKGLIYQSNTYWLSSSCVDAGFSNRFVRFDVHYVNSSRVDAYGVFHSDGGSYVSSYAVRPVVRLSENVKVSYDKTTNTATISM